MSTTKLLEQAKQLDLDERTILAHQIWASVEEECENAPLTEEFKAELERRLEAIKKNPDAGYSWNEVKARLGRLKRKQ